MADIIGEAAIVTGLTTVANGIDLTLNMSAEGFAEFVYTDYGGLRLYVIKQQDLNSHRCKYCKSALLDNNRQCFVCFDEDSICFECELDIGTAFYCSCWKEK